MTMLGKKVKVVSIHKTSPQYEQKDILGKELTLTKEPIFTWASLKYWYTLTGTDASGKETTVTGVRYEIC